MTRKEQIRVALHGRGKFTIRLYKFFGLPIWWSMRTD